MTQTGQVTGLRGHTTIYSKTHAHVILMQMNARQGYITYREKSNCTILKELRQLHNTKALMPVKDMTLHIRKKEKHLMIKA